MRKIHTLGCPAFDLQNELASGNNFPKWSPISRLGVNIGPSPNHQRNVHLVLNLSNGLVSPQFHVKFDDLFETTRYASGDFGSIPGSYSCWKFLAGLVKADGTPSPDTYGISGSIPVEENASFSQGASPDSNLHSNYTDISQNSHISDTDTSRPLPSDFDTSQPDGGDTNKDDEC